MNLTSHRAKSIYGVLLIILGIFTVALAIVLSPTFAAKYFSPDHNLASSTISQLNGYSVIFIFVGILLIVSGSILMNLKNLGGKIQEKLSIFHLKKIAEKEPRKTSLAFGFIFFGIIGITGLVLILWITPLGAGAGDDSIVYLGGARSIISGNGYSFYGDPIAQFPPLYSLFLAATGIFDNNLLQAARILGAILFGVNLVLFGLAIYLATERNFLAATCGVLFFFSSTSLIEFHSFIMSEPLFFTFLLACIILLSLYMIRPTLLRLIASSLCLGFGLVTRYIGIAFLLAALVIVFAGAGGQKPGRRFRDAIIWLVLAFTPLGFCTVRNMLMTGSSTRHGFSWHPANEFSYVGHIISRVFDFIAPVPLTDGVKLAIFCLVAASLSAIIIILFKRYIRDHKFIEINWPSMGFIVPLVCLLFTITYLIFLFISLSFFEENATTDLRILSPMLIGMTLGIISAIWTFSMTLKSPVVWSYFLILVVILISIRMPDAIRNAANIQRNGLDYASKRWRDSELIIFTRSLGKNVKIYSPNFELISFWTDRGYLIPPQKFYSHSTIEIPLYNQQMEAMCKDIRENGALFVYVTVPYESIQVVWDGGQFVWNGGPLAWNDGILLNQDASIPTYNAPYPTQAEIESTCHLPVLRAFADGIIYGGK